MSVPWLDLRLQGDPRLIIGYRQRSGIISCRRVELHEETFSFFKEVADNAISQIQTLTRRQYAYFGALEEDEYFFLETANIPNRQVSKRRRHSIINQTSQNDYPNGSRQGNTPGTEELASAITMVDETDNHPVLSDDELRSGKKMQLYMISYSTDSGYIGFIRKSNPQKSISPGNRYFQYGETLKNVSTPDFVFDDKIDLIVGPDEVAIFSDKVVQIIFRDVKLVLEGVEDNVKTVVDVFEDQLPLTETGKMLLNKFCGKNPTNAKRIHELVQHRIADLMLDPDSFTRALSRHNLNHLLSDDDEINLTIESIPSFFDFLEGRLFNDDHTQEPRRADRYSKRR